MYAILIVPGDVNAAEPSRTLASCPTARPAEASALGGSGRARTAPAPAVSRIAALLAASAPVPV